MAKKAQNIDEYIANAKPFALPILKHLRKLVHDACPDCEEKIKWSFPHFDCNGEIICSIAVFNSHAALTFWKAPLLKDPKKILVAKEGMGNLGKIESLADLPSDDDLMGFIRQAMELNEAGIKVNRRRPDQIELEIPDYLKKALRKIH